MKTHWKVFGILGFAIGVVMGFFNGSQFLYGPTVGDSITARLFLGVLGGVIFFVAAAALRIVLGGMLNLLDVTKKNLFPTNNSLSRASRVLRIFSLSIALILGTAGFLLAFTDSGNSMNQHLLSRMIASFINPLWISGFAVPLILFYPWVKFLRRQSIAIAISERHAKYCYRLVYIMIGGFSLLAIIDLGGSRAGGLWIPVTVLLGIPWYALNSILLFVFCKKAVK